MNYRTNLIGQALVKRIIQSRIADVITDMRNRKATSRRKVKAACITGIKVVNIPTFEKDDAELQELYDLLGSWKTIKERELSESGNNSFVITDRVLMVKLMYSLGYKLVKGFYDKGSLADSYQQDQQVQFLFIANECLPGTKAYKSAFLIKDRWNKETALTLSFSIVNDAHFQERQSQNIIWREYLRVSHKEPFMTDLNKDLISSVTECQQMWNKIATTPPFTGKVRKEWEVVTDEAVSLRSDIPAYNPMATAMRYGYPSLLPVGNLFVLWALLAGAGLRSSVNQHMKAISSNELKKFDQHFLRFLYPTG